jgi:acid stress-induced BolA-like protein IbaG/YrbA
MRKSKTDDYVGVIERTLTRRLNLKGAEFRLERAGGKVSGMVIAPKFRTMRDAKRQEVIWDALESEFGEQAVRRVGTLLAFTPEEWHVDDAS